MAKLIFGCGYLGLRVARLWRAAGETVFAVTRTPKRAQELAAEGIEPVVGDLLSSAQIPVPQEVRTALFAVAQGRDKGYSVYDLHVEGLKKALRCLPDALQRLIYISSTGVYGQVTGQAVDEQSATEPTRDGGQACLAAERLLQESRFGPQAVVLRLAGLYGPGRIPRAADLVAARPIEAASQGWLNLIHVDDAARIVLLAEQRAVSPRTYVVSDGQPVLRTDYYAELARLLGAPAPTFVEPPSELPAAQRATSDKRIDPRRMFEELRPILQYPDYRAGLAMAVAGEFDEAD